VNRAALRQLTLEPLEVAPRSAATAPDWPRGALLTGFLVLALALVSANDERAEALERADNAEYQAAAAIAALAKANDAPQIRLERNGPRLECRTFAIRDEWVHAIARECARLAGVLKAASSPP
jgi:hypothetical protein